MKHTSVASYGHNQTRCRSAKTLQLGFAGETCCKPLQPMTLPYNKKTSSIGATYASGTEKFIRSVGFRVLLI